MEGRKRVKSSVKFAEVHQRTMLRLRSLSKTNGILGYQPPKPQPHQPRPQSNTTPPKNPHLPNLNLRQSQPPKPRHQPHPPQMTKPLKITALKNIKNHIPEQGYMYFQINNTASHKYISSTVSKQGVLITEKNFIQFIPLGKLDNRCLVLEKLMDIPTIKNLKIYRPFLQWKKYSKFKRFSTLKENLSARIKVNFFQEISAIYTKLTSYFEQNKHKYLQSILSHLQILPTKKTPIKLDPLRIILQQLKQSYASALVQKNSKGTLNLLSDFTTLVKIVSYHYYKFCEEFSVIMIELVHDTISKHYQSFKCQPRQFATLMQKYKQTKKQKFVCSVELSISDDLNIKINTKHNSFFYPTKIKPQSSILNPNQIISIIMDHRNTSECLTNCDLKILTQNLQNLTARYETSNKKLKEKAKEVGEYLAKVNEDNMNSLNQFLKFLKKEMEDFSDQSLKLNNIIEIQKKLPKIQNFPESICLGMFTIGLKSVKDFLKEKVTKLWDQSCQKLPKEIEEILNQLQSEANNIEALTETAVWSIQDALRLKKQTQNFSILKDFHAQKIKNLQQKMVIFNKLNPRVSQSFSLRSIKFKQRIVATKIKAKTFTQSLNERIKNSKQQKNGIVQNLQQKISKLQQKLIQIRNQEDLEVVLQYLQSQLQDIVGRTKIQLDTISEIIKVENDQCGLNLLRRYTKAKQNFTAILKEFEYYRTIIMKQEQIRASMKSFLKSQGPTKIINTEPKKPHLQTLSSQITAIKLESGSKKIPQNPLLSKILQKINQVANLYRFIETIKKSHFFQIQLNNYSTLTVNQLYHDKQYLVISQEILDIEEKVYILEHFMKRDKEIRGRLEDCRVFGTLNAENSNRHFKSIQQAIEVLDSSIQMQKYKIQTFSNTFSQKWKEFFKDQISRTMELLKKGQKTNEILRRANNLHAIHVSNKEITQNRYPQIVKQIKKKWATLMAQFSDCPLIQVIKRSRSFQKIIEDIEQLQLKTQVKIQELLHQNYSTFPLLYMFDKSLVLKSVFEPLHFLKYFFYLHKVTYQNETYIFSTKEGEELKVQIKQGERNLNEIFSLIQVKIRKCMVQLIQSIPQNYDIVSLIDTMKIQSQYNVLEIKSDIENLAKKFKTNNPDKTSAAYSCRRFSALVMNRIQLRDSRLVNIPNTFKPIYSYCPQQQNFHLQICNIKTKLSYQLIPYKKNSLLISSRDLYQMASIHIALNNNNGETLILPDSSYLDIYSYRSMRYHVNLPLLSSQFHSIVFAALRTRVIVNFWNGEQLGEGVVEQVRGELWKCYQEQKEKNLKFINQRDRNVRWPIFITGSFFSVDQFAKIKPEVKCFFRNLKAIVPQVGSLLEWTAKQLEFATQVNFSKFLLEEQSEQKTNVYAQMKRHYLNLLKLYENLDEKYKRKFPLNLGTLKKLMTRSLRSAQYLSNQNNLNSQTFKTLLTQQLQSYFQKPPTSSPSSSPSNAPNFRQPQIKTTTRIKTDLRSCTPKRSITPSTEKCINSGLGKLQVVKNGGKDYFLGKVQEFRMVVRNCHMVAVVGDKMSGKSRIIGEFLREYNHVEWICLHPTALGPEIWQQTNSLFKLKKYQSYKFLLFHGNLQPECYPFLQTTLKSKILHFSSGSRIEFTQTPKIIFQVQNFSTLEPATLVQLHWVYVSGAEVRWEGVLERLLEEMEVEVGGGAGAGEDGKVGDKEREKERVGKWRFLERECKNMLAEIFEVSYDRTIDGLKKAQIVIQIMDIFRTFLPQTQAPKKPPTSQKSQKSLFVLFCYSTHLTLSSTTPKYQRKCLYLLDSYMQRNHYPLFPKPLEVVPRVEEVQGDVFVRFQHSDWGEYYSVSGSLGLVMRYQVITQAYYLNRLLDNKVNLMAIKSKSSSNSYLQSLILNNQETHAITFLPSTSYNQILQKLLHKTQCLSSSSLSPSHSPNLILLIQDLNLIQSPSTPSTSSSSSSQPQPQLQCPSQLLSNIKYLIDVKNVIKDNHVRREELTAFVTVGEDMEIPEELAHLHRVRLVVEGCAEGIWNWLVSGRVRNNSENSKQIINQQEYSQMTSILLLLQHLKYTFPQCWKHSFQPSLLPQYLQLLQKKSKQDWPKYLQNLLTPTPPLPPTQTDKIQSQSILFKEVYRMLVKGICLQLDSEELGKFRRVEGRGREDCAGGRGGEGGGDGSGGGEMCGLGVAVGEDGDYDYVKINGQRILQIMIQNSSEISQTQSFILQSLTLNPTLTTFQLTQTFPNYTTFLSFLQQKVRSYHYQQFSGVILYIPAEIVRQDYFILSYLAEFQIQKDQREEIGKGKGREMGKEMGELGNVVFVVDYLEGDWRFVKELERLPRLRQKCILLTLIEQSKTSLSQKIFNNLPQKTKTRKQTKQTIQKILKTFQALTKPTPTPTTPNLPNIPTPKQPTPINSTLPKQNFFTEFSKQPLLTHQLLPPHTHEKLAIKIMEIYQLKLAKLEKCQIVLEGVLAEIGRIGAQRQYVGERLREVGGRIGVIEANLEDLRSRQKNAKVVTIKIQKKQPSQQQKTYKPKQPHPKTTKQLPQSQSQWQNLKNSWASSQKIKTKLKTCLKQAIQLINRTQVSQIKFICNNSSNTISTDLIEALNLALLGTGIQSQYKVYMDINLMFRIRDCRFCDRTTECLELILAKMEQFFTKIQEIRIIRHIIQWMYYGAKLQLHNRQNLPQKKSLQNLQQSHTRPTQTKKSIACKQQSQQQIQDSEEQDLIEQESDEDTQKICIMSLGKKIKEMEEELVGLKREEVDLRIGGGNFGVLGEVGKLGEFGIREVQRIGRIKDSLLFSVIYQILCMELLHGYSSYQLTQIKSHIQHTISQINSTFNPNQIQTQLWDHPLPSVSSTPTSHMSDIITSHQRMKMKRFMEEIQVARHRDKEKERERDKEKEIVVINRQGIFAKIIDVIHTEKADKQGNRNQCQVIEVDESYWQNYTPDLPQPQPQPRSHHHHNQPHPPKFLLTNSLGPLDPRLSTLNCTKITQKFTIFDFGLDSEDIREYVVNRLGYSHVGVGDETLWVDQQLMRMVEGVLGKFGDVDWFGGEAEVREIRDMIGKICEMAQSRHHNQPTPQSTHCITKFLTLYTLFQTSHKISLQSLQSQQSVPHPPPLQLLNTSQQFLQMFDSVIEEHLRRDEGKLHGRINVAHSAVYQCLVLKLMDSRIGDFFRIGFFLGGWEGLGELLYVPPLDVRFKKLLTNQQLQQSDMTRPQKPRNPRPNPPNMPTSPSSPSLNLLQKLSITKKTVPNQLPIVLHQEIQKMLNQLRRRTPLYNNEEMEMEMEMERGREMGRERGRGNGRSVWVCQGDVGFWGEVFGDRGCCSMQDNRVWVYGKDKKLPEQLTQSSSPIHSRTIILTTPTQKPHWLHTQLSTLQIPYKTATPQQICQILWQDLNKTTQTYHIFTQIEEEINQIYPFSINDGSNTSGGNGNGNGNGNGGKGDLKFSGFCQLYMRYWRFVGFVRSMGEAQGDGNDGTRVVGSQLKVDQSFGEDYGRSRTFTKLELSQLKKIYMGLKKAQIPWKPHQTQTHPYSYITKFLTYLDSQSHNITTTNIKQLQQTLQQNLPQILNSIPNHPIREQIINKNKQLQAYVDKEMFYGTGQGQRQGERERDGKLNRIVAELYGLVEKVGREREGRSLGQDGVQVRGRLRVNRPISVHGFV